MAIVLWTVTGMLAAQLLFVIWNLSYLPKLGGTGTGRLQLVSESEPRPLLSVLIPARDEAANISDCVRASLTEPSPRIEVLMLDDQSRDGTTELALTAAAGDCRFRALQGGTLPAGWTGKSHACSQLAAAARGEWYLFLDADARLGGEALAKALDTAIAQGNGLVTGFPRQETSSWLEKLVVPLMGFTIACHLPIRLVRESKNPRFVAAHGAFLLIHRDTYAAIGGHAAFAGHLVDDMQLARAVKASGAPVTLADISDHVSMRMYRDASGVWNGYKKNIFAGVGRSTILLGGLLAAYLSMYVLPAACLIWLLLLGFGFENGTPNEEFVALSLPATCGFLIGLAIKYAADRRDGHPFFYALLLPAGVLALAGIALASWRASISGRGYRWKGRHYS